MKNKRGNTLIEVIVSIVIVSIVIISLSSVFISSKRIKANIDRKENIYQEISNVLVIFTSDPSNGAEKINANYQITSLDSKIYFTKNFIQADSVTTNYLEYNITNLADGFYKIEITVYVNNEIMNIGSYEKLERTVYGGN